MEISRQVVALTDGVVVEVMRRGDLDAAGAEFEIDVAVGDDRDFAIGQRQLCHLADHVLVAFVFRMNHDGGIAEHGFRAGGGHHQAARAIGQRIADVPHEAVFFFLHHFEVGDGGVQLSGPSSPGACRGRSGLR